MSEPSVTTSPPPPTRRSVDLCKGGSALNRSSIGSRKPSPTPSAQRTRSPEPVESERSDDQPVHTARSQMTAQDRPDSPVSHRPEWSLRQLERFQTFHERHIGPSPDEIESMLELIGQPDIPSLIDTVLPENIRESEPL